VSGSNGHSIPPAFVDPDMAGAHRVLDGHWGPEVQAFCTYPVPNPFVDPGERRHAELKTLRAENAQLRETVRVLADALKAMATK